jgi:hypothetical protein
MRYSLFYSFRDTTKPPRFATPRSLSRLFDNALPDQQGGAISKNNSQGQKGDL